MIQAMTIRQLRAAMEATGLTAGEFAERVGVSIRTVFRWLAGDRIITAPYAALIRERVPELRKAHS